MKRAKRLIEALLVLVAALGTTVASAAATDPLMYDCLVQYEDQIKVPAPEAGVLVQMAVKEGSQVRQGEVLAKIYDDEVQMQKKAAEYALGAAYKSATDDIQFRYAQKSADVAEKAYETMVESNNTVAKAVAEVDVLKAKLEWEAAILSAEKAEHDQDLAKFDYHQKKAERDASDLALKRRTIIAPFDGEVLNLYRHQDEWVSPGDAIMQLVRLDTMQVEGPLEQSAYDPHEVNGCDVTVEVEMARGRKEQFAGRIAFISSQVELDGSYLVRAEVANRQEHGRWMLRDQMKATMKIHLGTGTGAATDVSLAP
jgi:multidrug resistance efflux pump